MERYNNNNHYNNQHNYSYGGSGAAGAFIANPSGSRGGSSYANGSGASAANSNYQQRAIFPRNDRMRDNTLNNEQAQQDWATIKDAIVKIYAQKASTLSYEELYRTCYYLVLYKHGEMLYENVKKTTVEMLQPMAQ